MTGKNYIAIVLLVLCVVGLEVEGRRRRGQRPKNTTNIEQNHNTACGENPQCYYEFILPIVKEAGKAILEANDIKIETKEDDFDLVTVYDRKIEDSFKTTIKRKYPDHKFIGEEESAAKKSISLWTDDPTWFIDPIDGTSNFVRRFPMSCVSAALTIKKEIVLGVIYNPASNELYSAVKGKGAFLNGKPIKTSGQKDISKAMVNMELSLARNDKYRDLYVYRFKHLISVIQGIRAIGSAAMGLSFVANSTMDAYQVDGLYPWDAAAGVLIVREAGGYVGGSTGEEFDLMEPNYVAAATKPLYDQLVEVIRQADDERERMAEDSKKETTKLARK